MSRFLGTRLTLAVDRVAVPAGERAAVTLTITNEAPRTLYLAGSDCQIISDVEVDGPPRQPADAGRRWPGDAGILKQVAVSDAALAPVLPLEALQHRDVAWGCDSAFHVRDLDPGETLRLAAAWPATTAYGEPLPDGQYGLTARVRHLGRGQPPQDPRPDGRVQEVRIPIAVVLGRPARLSPGQVMDVVLSDPRFAAWLAATPREQWSGAHLQYRDDAWQFTLEVGLDDAERRASVVVDPATGAVVAVELP